MRYVQLDCFIISETKLDNLFPSSQFMIKDDFEDRVRRDRDKDRGLIEYVRKFVICKRLKNIEAVYQDQFL